MRRRGDLVVVGARDAATAVAENAPRAGTEVAARVATETGRRRRGNRGDVEFLPAALLDVDEPPSPLRGVVVLALAALLLTVVAWSYFGRVASYATASGKVQAVGRTKVVEAQQIGRVVEILARDGDRVKAGAALIRLDPTDAAAARTIIVDQRADLLAQNARRRAELGAVHADPIPSDPAISWDDDVPQRVRDRETGVLRADLAALTATLSTLAGRRAAAVLERDKFSAVITAQKALVAVTAENASMADELQQTGWNSRAKSLDLVEDLRGQQVALTAYEGKLADAQAAVATLDSEAVKTREAFASAASDALAAAERQIADLDQRLIKADQTLSQMTVASPVAGIVHASAVTTVGQFVRPTQQLMQVVPETAAIEIVAYLQNTDVGLVRQGQDVTIKVDSFNYATYGTVDGTVVQVGNDALATTGKSTLQSATLDGGYGESTAAQRTGTLKFPVVVRAERPTISIDGKLVALTPGMSVSVEIETENRRLIDYMASPVAELLSTAAHER